MRLVVLGLLAFPWLLVLLVSACVTQDAKTAERYRWWNGLGPVLPHDSFPTDCSLCHEGTDWNTLVADFRFDHERETGVPLRGAHKRAACLRCHNDRGPVADFQVQGCSGCHEDVHRAMLGPDCQSCHQEESWHPVGMVGRHARTRFPLTAAHVNVSCNRCHPGSFVGNFAPTSPECVSCHLDDLSRATNPPHIALGLVDRCDRCHQPTRWREASTR